MSVLSNFSPDRRAGCRRSLANECYRCDHKNDGCDANRCPLADPSAQRSGPASGHLVNNNRRRAGLLIRCLRAVDARPCLVTLIRTSSAKLDRGDESVTATVQRLDEARGLG
jgi:hypothetical protein